MDVNEKHTEKQPHSIVIADFGIEIDVNKEHPGKQY
jgi:hypothetical protein